MTPVRVSGNKRAKISAATNHHGDLKKLGKGENDVEDGFWWFFFEIEALLPADDRNPDDWTPFQSQVRSGHVTINVNGRNEDISKDKVRPDDNPLKAYIDTSQAGKYYWLDSPDIQKVQTGSDHLNHQVLSDDVLYNIDFMLINKKDQRRNCSATLILELTIENHIASWQVR
jgi:hypothetical protein